MFKKIIVERNSSESFLPPWARFEHQQRYLYASQYVKGKDVVDCACGSGESSAIFARAGATKVIGIDVDQGSINNASEEYKLPNLTFTKSNGVKIPLSDGSCDVLISLETIEHISDDLTFVQEVERVLRPKGLLICSTPNREVTNPHTSISNKPLNQFHIREYSFNEFVQLFDRKFSLITSNGQNPSLKIRRQSFHFIARIFGSRLSIRLLQIWKCRWFLFRESRLHCVQGGDPQSFEYFVFIFQKN